MKTPNRVIAMWRFDQRYNWFEDKNWIFVTDLHIIQKKSSDFIVIPGQSNFPIIIILKKEKAFRGTQCLSILTVSKC